MSERIVRCIVLVSCLTVRLYERISSIVRRIDCCMLVAARTSQCVADELKVRERPPHATSHIVGHVPYAAPASKDLKRHDCTSRTMSLIMRYVFIANIS